MPRNFDEIFITILKKNNNNKKYVIKNKCKNESQYVYFYFANLRAIPRTCTCNGKKKKIFS